MLPVLGPPWHVGLKHACHARRPSNSEAFARRLAEGCSIAGRQLLLVLGQMRATWHLALQNQTGAAMASVVLTAPCAEMPVSAATTILLSKGWSGN